MNVSLKKNIPESIKPRLGEVLFYQLLPYLGNMKELDFLDKNGIDTKVGIELLGDVDTYNDTLADFLTECDTRLPEMDKYKEAKDMENYAILVHAMKGDSKYLGFSKLAELSYNHQIESQNNNIDYINEHYDELIKETNRVIEVVKDYLG